MPPPASLTDELQDLLQEWMEEVHRSRPQRLAQCMPSTCPRTAANLSAVEAYQPGTSPTVAVGVAQRPQFMFLAHLFHIWVLPGEMRMLKGESSIIPTWYQADRCF